MAIFAVTNKEVSNILTQFQASDSVGDACTLPTLAPYTLNLFHNGAGAFPVLGDKIFLDSEGLTGLFTGSAHRQASDLSYIVTNASSILIDPGC